MFTRSSLTFYGNWFFSDVCWWGFTVRCASKRPLNSERSTKLLLTFMYIQCCANSSFLYILLLSIQTVLQAFKVFLWILAVFTLIFSLVQFSEDFLFVCFLSYLTLIFKSFSVVYITDKLAKRLLIFNFSTLLIAWSHFFSWISPPKKLMPKIT